MTYEVTTSISIITTQITLWGHFIHHCDKTKHSVSIWKKGKLGQDWQRFETWYLQNSLMTQTVSSHRQPHDIVTCKFKIFCVFFKQLCAFNFFAIISVVPSLVSAWKWPCTQNQVSIILFGLTWPAKSPLNPIHHFGMNLNCKPSLTHHQCWTSLILLWVNGSKSLQPCSNICWRVWNLKRRGC